MEELKMKETTTIQISVYDWVNMEEIVYETQVRSVEDMVALTYQFDNKVKYKKPTDQNWYYAKTMLKRLFKQDLIKTPNIEHIATNDLNKIYEGNGQAEEEVILKNKKVQKRDGPEKSNSILKMNQIRVISEEELAEQLYDLYIKDYFIGMYNLNTYVGSFDNCLAEINDIERQLSPTLVDSTYSKAMRDIRNREVTIEFPSF